MGAREEKQVLRKKIRAIRDSLSKNEMEQAAAQAANYLFHTQIYKNCKTLFTYVSFEYELSTYPLIKAALLDKKNVAVPKVLKKRDMKFYLITSINDLSPGYMGIPEPCQGKELLPNADSLILLPGMVFSGRGERIGYGGGFYDAWLARMKEKNSRGILIGYAYDFQIDYRENFPSEPHDWKVDFMITPSGIIYSS